MHSSSAYRQRDTCPAFHHRAALKGHTEAVRVLVEYGAPPAAEDTYGRTPLDCARSSPLFRQECAALLVAAGGGAGRAGAAGAAGLSLGLNDSGGNGHGSNDADEALRAAQRALKAMTLAVSAAESGKGLPSLDEDDNLWDRAPTAAPGLPYGGSVASTAAFLGGPNSSVAGYSAAASGVSAGPTEAHDGSVAGVIRSPKRASPGRSLHALPPVPPPLPVNGKKSALKKKTHFGPLPGSSPPPTGAGDVPLSWAGEAAMADSYPCRVERGEDTLPDPFRRVSKTQFICSVVFSGPLRGSVRAFSMQLGERCPSI